MYQYDEYDRKIVRERVAQFRDQTRRYLAGELTKDEFRYLRVQNGLYIQRYAPMLRIAVPYGLLCSKQLRRLAHVARKYDRGYGHFTTRQNLQLNWPELPRVPDILEELAEVEMHGIQTSGNCIRNITTDAFAGIAPDEIADPRPLCEILRQWSTFHPEFAYLPRKFKIAVSGTVEDRAVTYLHDIGLHVLKNDQGEIGFRVIVGGGMGRTPVIGKVIREFLPWQHILSYCEAILRVYNRYGRRDNPFKARIKILVNATGPEKFAQQVEEEWVHLKDGPSTITQAEYARVAAHFKSPDYRTLPPINAGYEASRRNSIPFAKWVERNVRAHRVPGYAAVTLSLKKPGVAPGDCTSDQMDFIADLAERYSFGELRVTHEQNLVLSDVALSDLFELWQKARGAGLATPNIGLITDIICCPGGDFCDLANAKSIPIANAIQERFEDLDYQHDIGDIEINISGCMNSCGHHHVGHIGILGVDKHDSEWYQISIGGRQGLAAALGKVIGPSFAAAEVPDVIEKLIAVYVAQRRDEELFIDVVERLGIEPFQTAVYGERTRGLRGERKVANG
ncbi:Sulfite reductase (NADPH) hemoprotein beta-component [Georgfuchsia toluolica]|uniref:Sulfite reductase (NADPH) hemoprotein beta-component n=1 Tax=Georgfuchsia toluolica TaxID=424218 RepID=A0A916NA80_9PROT|nr:nitrite/sulfite reductase [Georgfuchsia toluolica]CAG4885027.1 Sulfite reductase (NADPH) hemoprotein beta-component [Georgfuchsia toluolica]